MRNKAQALELLEKWPVEKRGRTRLIGPDGSRCALGVMAGDKIKAACRANTYQMFFGPEYGLSRDECWEIVGANDSRGFDAAVEYVKGLPDDDQVS